MGHIEHYKLGAARSNNPMNFMSIWDSKLWDFLCWVRRPKTLFCTSGYSLVLVVSEIIFVCRRWGHCEHYSVAFKAKKVLCREQLFSLARARGSLNPPASCLLVFSNKRSWGKVLNRIWEAQREGIMEKTETLTGRQEFEPAWPHCSSTWTKNLSAASIKWFVMSVDF